MAEAFERIGPAVPQGYGQTEIGLISLLSAADVAPWPEAVTSAGRPCVEVQVRDIVNAIIHYAGPIEHAFAAHPDVDQADKRDLLGLLTTATSSAPGRARG